MGGLRMLAVASYPLAIYGGLSFTGPRTVAMILGVVLVVRFVALRPRGSATPASLLLLPVAVVAPALLLAALFDEGRALLLVPSLINGALLVAFGRTLWRGPSMVEVFARTQGQVPSERRAYCRAVTLVWCVFFVVNGGVALWLAFYASVAGWTLYTGFVAYVLIGVLLVAEVIYRRWRYPTLRDATGAPTTSPGT